MDHTIRRATQADAEALSLLGAATVLETYTTILPGADLLTFCRTKHSAAHYTTLLSDPDCTIWIAEARLGSPIGYLVLMPATLPVEGPSPGDLEVMRIYVLQAYHKTGLGHALMQLAVAEARRRQAPRLVLGMHNDNIRALAFYRRQGFTVIAARTFIVGNSVCCDSVLALPLTKLE
jgi:ribosomal protein S18 acetylase RimI-like enzyme